MQQEALIHRPRGAMPPLPSSNGPPEQSHSSSRPVTVTAALPADCGTMIGELLPTTMSAAAQTQGGGLMGPPPAAAAAAAAGHMGQAAPMEWIPDSEAAANAAFNQPYSSLIAGDQQQQQHLAQLEAIPGMAAAQAVVHAALAASQQQQQVQPTADHNGDVNGHLYHGHQGLPGMGFSSPEQLRGPGEEEAQGGGRQRPPLHPSRQLQQGAMRAKLPPSGLVQRRPQATGPRLYRPQQPQHGTPAVAAPVRHPAQKGGQQGRAGAGFRPFNASKTASARLTGSLQGGADGVAPVAQAGTPSPRVKGARGFARIGANPIQQQQQQQVPLQQQHNGGVAASPSSTNMAAAGGLGTAAAMAPGLAAEGALAASSLEGVATGLRGLSSDPPTIQDCWRLGYLLGQAQRQGQAAAVGGSMGGLLGSLQAAMQQLKAQECPSRPTRKPCMSDVLRARSNSSSPRQPQAAGGGGDTPGGGERPSRANSAPPGALTWGLGALLAGQEQAQALLAAAVGEGSPLGGGTSSAGATAAEPKCAVPGDDSKGQMVGDGAVAAASPPDLLLQQSLELLRTQAASWDAAPPVAAGVNHSAAAAAAGLASPRPEGEEGAHVAAAAATTAGMKRGRSTQSPDAPVTQPSRAKRPGAHKRLRSVWLSTRQNGQQQEQQAAQEQPQLQQAEALDLQPPPQQQQQEQVQALPEEQLSSSLSRRMGDISSLLGSTHATLLHLAAAAGGAGAVSSSSALLRHAGGTAGAAVAAGEAGSDLAAAAEEAQQVEGEDAAVREEGGCPVQQALLELQQLQELRSAALATHQLQLLQAQQDAAWQQEQEQLALQQAAAEAEQEAGLAVGQDGRRTSYRRKVTSCRLQPLVGEDPEQGRRGSRARGGWEGAAAARSGSDGSGWGGQPAQPRRSRRASADVAAAAAAGDDPDDSDYTGERRTSSRRRQASCRLQPLEGSRSAPPRSQQLSRFGLEQQRQRQWHHQDGTPDLEYDEDDEEEEGVWEASLYHEEEGPEGDGTGKPRGCQGQGVGMPDGRHLQPSGELRRPDLPPRPPSARPSSPPVSHPQQQPQQPPDVSSWLTEDERRLYALAVPARAAAKAAAAALAGPRPTPAVPRPPGASRPRPRSGGVKRPWQPRAAPNERNWDEAHFREVAARSEAQLEKLGTKQLGRLVPEHATARAAVLLLLHAQGWPNHVLWERWQEMHPPGSLAMMVHLKHGVNLAPGLPGREAIARCRLKASVDAGWGSITLVQATLEGMAEVLRRCPNVQHIALASGHDIPVRMISEGLLLPGVSLFGAYQFPEREQTILMNAVTETLQLEGGLSATEASLWGNCLTFHHQWMVLSRQHALALVALKGDILKYGKLIHKACNSVKAGMAPDEFIVVTALRAHRCVRSVTRCELAHGMSYGPGTLLNSYPTLVLFPAETSPHPVLWTDPSTLVKCQVEKEGWSGVSKPTTKLMSLNQCLGVAVERKAIFFRKVEIRQTHGTELVLLLSSLEAMWRDGKGPGAAGAAAGLGRSSKRRRKGAKAGPSRSGSRANSASSTQDVPGPSSSGLQQGEEGEDDLEEGEEVEEEQQEEEGAQMEEGDAEQAVTCAQQQQQQEEGMSGAAGASPPQDDEQDHQQQQDQEQHLQQEQLSGDYIDGLQQQDQQQQQQQQQQWEAGGESPGAAKRGSDTASAGGAAAASGAGAAGSCVLGQSLSDAAAAVEEVPSVVPAVLRGEPVQGQAQVVGAGELGDPRAEQAQAEGAGELCPPAVEQALGAGEEAAAEVAAPADGASRQGSPGSAEGSANMQQQQAEAGPAVEQQIEQLGQGQQQQQQQEQKGGQCQEAGRAGREVEALEGDGQLTCESVDGGQAAGQVQQQQQQREGEEPVVEGLVEVAAVQPVMEPPAELPQQALQLEVQQQQPPKELGQVHKEQQQQQQQQQQQPPLQSPVALPTNGGHPMQ